MKRTRLQNLTQSCLLALSLSLVLSCKKNPSESWSEADLQELQQRWDLDTAPPLQVLASVKKLENDTALRIFDAWAKKILETQRNDPKSPLNKIRLMFNPDHLSTMSIETAMTLTRTEGSGTHAALVRERTPQDYLYHALWSRIADAAALAKYSRASRHMKHYLSNSGKPLRYGQKDSQELLSAAGQAESGPAPDPVGIQIESEALKNEMKKRGQLISDKDAENIVSMNRSERAYYLARLKIFVSLAQHIQSKSLNIKSESESLAGFIRNKKTPTTSEFTQAIWRTHRPMSRAWLLLSSPAQSDMYYAMGSFTVTHTALPIDLRIENNFLKIRFSQWKSIFDRYNWDNGKFVTLLSGWCWKTGSNHCFNIEELLTIQVSDKSLSRMHKLGIAREFEIFGQTTVKTVWDGVPLTDLNNNAKLKFWSELSQILSQWQLPPQDALE
ncbi:MAG: hypothetical protein FJY29_08865 [Betaproteobacteria bacterium]|nr:hypothetical protein [Betaproteobacteria bacterium]